MKPQKTDRICFAATLYAFLLYVVHCTDEELRNTFFVFDHTMPRGLARRVANSYQFPHIKREGPTFRWVNWLRYRWNFWHHVPSMDNHTLIFAQDHPFAASVLIGHRNYTFIEDSTRVCTNVYTRHHEVEKMQRERSKWFYPLMRRFYGPVLHNAWALNEQCDSMLVSGIDPHPWLKGKHQKLVQPMNHTLWQSFSTEKQAFLIKAFDLTDEDMRMIESYENVLLTQPLWTDAMTYEEHRDCYRRILAHYPEGSVIVKTHPREWFPYRKEFPDVAVFDKNVPMEMFNMLGTKFRRVITIFSTSVNQFDEHVEIDWFGASIHPKLKDYDTPIPPRAHQVVL